MSNKYIFVLANCFEILENSVYSVNLQLTDKSKKVCRTTIMFVIASGVPEILSYVVWWYKYYKYNETDAHTIPDYKISIHSLNRSDYVNMCYAANTGPSTAYLNEFERFTIFKES